MIFAEKPLVFVSYSRKDKSRVDDLVRRLNSKGIRTWVDRQDIVGGEWRQNIKRGLRHSRFFLACLSQNTQERGEVLQYEHDSALQVQHERLEGEIYLLPVRLEQCETPPEMREIQCVDLFEPDGWDCLLRALRSKAQTRTAVWLAAAVALALVLSGAWWWLRPSADAEFISARSAGKSAPFNKTMRLGLTLWKMEPSRDSDAPSVREIVHPPADGNRPLPSVSWTPVRLPSNQGFQLGDKFQAGVESSRTGYLYVVNRSLRTDGSMGPASLIYPSSRIRGGDNAVWPGRLIRLPDRDSNPPYWEFQSSRPDYAGEQIVLLLVPQRLDDMSDGMTIGDETLSEWTRRFGNGVKPASQRSDSSRLTPAEAAARNDGTPLASSAPLPQVVFEAERSRDTGMLTVTTIRVRAKQ